jgi:hypothetical protein
VAIAAFQWPRDKKVDGIIYEEHPLNNTPKAIHLISCRKKGAEGAKGAI